MRLPDCQLSDRRIENVRVGGDLEGCSPTTSCPVLLLAFYFPPENASGAARPYRFYKYLRRLGYDVQVLTASPQEVGHPQENVVCVPGRTQGQRRKLLWLLTRHLLGHWVADRSMSWALAAEEVAGRFVSGKSGCVVVSTSEPVISHVLGGLLKRRWGMRWIADFRDPLTGNPFRQGSGIRATFDSLVEKWTFRNADALIANTDATLEMWKKKYPKYARKMFLIWNGFDPEDGIGPRSIPPRGYRLLVHAGMIYGIRDPGILLSSLHRLVERGLLSPNKFRVRMIGLLQDGWVRNPSPVEELVRWGCLEYDGRLVPRKEAEEAIASADSLILLDSHVEGGAVQVPAKLFDYVRVGRPILATTTRNSPVDRLLSQSGVSYTSIYPDDSPEEVDQKVMHFLTLPLEPVIASRWFWGQFDAVAQTRQFINLIQSLPQ